MVIQILKNVNIACLHIDGDNKTQVTYSFRETLSELHIQYRVKNQKSASLGSAVSKKKRKKKEKNLSDAICIVEWHTSALPLTVLKRIYRHLWSVTVSVNRGPQD